jgi:hypothetical protein
MPARIRPPASKENSPGLSAARTVGPVGGGHMTQARQCLDTGASFLRNPNGLVNLAFPRGEEVVFDQPSGSMSKTPFVLR